MLVNPGAGFFNSFDPAGFVTVDKPPVGLWVQAAFAGALGFSGWVLVLPQALAGVGSVLLIYLIIARPFGKPAGLAAALALAVTPILVAVSRNGTMDTQLIFVILLALWVALKATRERSLPWLLVSVILIGIGFNIKMIQAFVLVPAVLVIYFLGTTGFSFRKRALHLGLAVLVLLAVSLSWAVAVDLVPATQRPYIGGSGDNTVLGLIVNYNGLERLGLENGGRPFMGDGARERNRSFLQGGQFSGSIQSAGANVTSSGPAGVSPGAGSPTGYLGIGGGAAGGMTNEEGPPGITRFFGEQLAGQFSWLLPLALIGLLAWVRRPSSPILSGSGGSGVAGERGLTIIAMLLWLVPGLLFFSFTTAFGHTYYIATIAPPLAGLVGIGVVVMYREYLGESRRGWLLPGAVLVTGLLQTLFLSYDAAWSGPLIPLVLLATLGCTGVLVSLRIRRDAVPRNHQRYFVVIALGLLFIAPLVWSCTPLVSGNGNNQPVAGPQASRFGAGRGQGTGDLPGMAGTGFIQERAGRERFFGPGNGSYVPGRGSPDLSGTGGVPDTLLADYLLAHNTNETWILAVPSAMEGAGLIIETGRPVMALGGFSGTDQILNVTSLTSLIRDGKVRYFLSGGLGFGGGEIDAGNAGIFDWVTAHCTAVNLPGGNGNEVNATGAMGTLYDCAGAAG